MINISVVSDVSCPWCVIGYRALCAALDELRLVDQVEVSWRPFELNPDMPREGQDVGEHLQQKYGATPEQSKANRHVIRERGLAVGYDFDFADAGRIYNTFDAHRLLHWARESGLQTELKLGLFDLYFKRQGNPSRHKELLEVVAKTGLDSQVAQSILQSERYAEQVRAQESLANQQGINAVPAFIFNDRYLMSGGQPKETFVQMLRGVAQEAAQKS